MNSFSQRTGYARKGLSLHSVLLTCSAIVVAGIFFVDFRKGSPNEQNSSAPAYIAPSKGEDTEKSVADIVNDATTFYNMLTSAQQTTLLQTYTTSLARKWSNLPCGTSCRNGLQLGTNLTTAQFTAAMKVIADALSDATNNGYDEFHQMNMAEAYLHANGGGSGYDSTLRWISFLNTPTATGPWMLQFGGHHFAANIAFNNGHVIGATPYFMGLEPKTFTYANVDYDPLGDEKTAFANALASLSGTQLSAATLSSSFSDCVMVPGETNGGTSTFPAYAMGQAISGLTTAQKALIMAVIEDYTGDMDDATHAYMYALYESELDQTYFSYHGTGTAGSASSFLTVQGDYVRISGPHVWIEFSCQAGVVIQSQIHYHTIWRDRTHDYGVDLTSTENLDGDSATAGLSENSIKSISLYPNPVTDMIYASIPSSLNNASLICVDAQGKLAMRETGLNGTSIQVRTDKLGRGTYFMTITDATHTYRGKFIKL